MIVKRKVELRSDTELGLLVFCDAVLSAARRTWQCRRKDSLKSSINLGAFSSKAQKQGFCCAVKRWSGEDHQRTCIPTQKTCSSPVAAGNHELAQLLVYFAVGLGSGGQRKWHIVFLLPEMPEKDCGIFQVKIYMLKMGTTFSRCRFL